MFAGKPIIGIAGGIGSGKTFVANLFGELGCLVISADELVRQVHADPKVKQTLREWWGDGIFDPAGHLNRAAVALKIFNNAAERKRLEELLHPLVSQRRDEQMQAHAHDAQVLAFVWDTPLLFETGLNSRCDAVVFVEVPEGVRLERVSKTRGWDEHQLKQRENLQMPLYKKREMSDHTVSNTTGADQVRVQVREVLSRILAGMTPTSGIQ